VSSQFAADAESHYYEAPIKKQVIWINLFSDNGTPHVSGSSDTKPPTMTTEVVGWVRVTMSPSNMLDKQARRFQPRAGDGGAGAGGSAARWPSSWRAA
jgi:two-component system sensor histidine kinase UhpB